MYTLRKFYHKVNANGMRWLEVDLAEVLAADVRTLTATYGQSRMILTHDASPNVQYLFDFTQDGATFVQPFFSAITVANWFIALANKALPTVEFTATKTVKAKYANALEANFSVEEVIPGAGPNPTVPFSERTDLLLTHPTLSPGLVEANVLVEVNGFLHRTYSSERGLYVKQGGRSAQVAKINSVGIVSLAPLGGCKIYPIVESMITGLPEDGATLDTPLYLNVQDVDWDNCTAMLSLCGYLIPLGSTFRSIGNSGFELNLLRYPYLENFLKAEKYLDLQRIRAAISTNPLAPTMISVPESKGRNFLLELLTTSQSFVIAVQSPDVYCDKIPLETTQHPCVFLHHETVTSPAVHHDGRLMSYVLEDEGDKWVVIVPDGIHDRLRMHSIQWHNAPAVDSVRTNLHRLQPGRGAILDIKRDLFI
jgi:hypothetical protein